MPSLIKKRQYNTIHARRSLPVLAMSALFLASCSSGSSDAPADIEQPPTDGEVPAVETPVVDTPVVDTPDVEEPAGVVSAFGEIQSGIFTAICAECHAGTFPSAGLRLDEESSFAAIVSVPSNQVPALSLIEPGDPDNSYLVQKIEGVAAVGGRMPLGGPQLPQESIDLVRQWVTDGALPATPEALALAPRVVSASVGDEARINQLPESLTLVWSSPVDAESMNAASVVSLLRSGGDGSFDDGNEVAIEVAVVDSGNPYVTTLLTDVSAPAEDDYLLRIAGVGDIPARAQDARSIDGDGDGQAGGDFSRYFSVENNQ